MAVHSQGSCGSIVYVKTSFVIPSGLRVTEVAHDIQQQVSRFITADLSLVNSYDTWHGTTHNLHVSVALTCDIYMCMYVCRYKECVEAAAQDYPG